MDAATATLPEFFDTHAHLDYRYPFSVEAYIANAKASGVTRFITISAHPDALDRVPPLAERFPEVYFTVGIHPHEAKDYNAEIEAKMNSLRHNPKCVALGEIGLDYYYDHSPRDLQRTVFERQLELALEWKLPVVIHAREAEADLLLHLESYAKKCELPQGPGVIHCFSGTVAFAQACLKLGFHISVSGIVTFKKSEEIQEAVRQTPLDRLLLETDAPYLAPIPYRGKINQSAYLIETAKYVATLKGISLVDLSAATVANSRRLFSV